MRKLIIFLMLFLLFFPLSKISAHGGVESSVGNITVNFFQDPFAPIINKNVLMTFLIEDKESEKRLENFPAILNIKETTYGHKDQDKTILSKQVTSDVNGVITLNYIFSKDKIYDIELEFPQIKEEEDSVGFLIQPRLDLEKNNYKNILIILLALISGIGIGYKIRYYNFKKLDKSKLFKRK